MIISVINLTRGRLTDEAVQSAIRAVNRQVSQDFVPYWGFGGQLRLEGKSSKKRSNATSDMRGDAVLYLCNDVGNSGVDGYHDKTYRGIPYGIVYLELSELLNEAWTVTLSHEALELIGDPEANLLVQGPHPRFPKRNVFHWFEMCDAVQNEQYELDGIAVSNFVLPLYFTSSKERGGRNDFLGTMVAGKTLRSFTVNPGGYIGFFDPRTGRDGNYEQADDARAAARLRIKKRLKIGRGVLRRQRTRGVAKR